MAYPGESGVARREYTVDEGGDRGEEKQGIAAVSGKCSGESAGGHREECGYHGQEARVGDSLIGSEANGEGSATGDEATAGMVDENADEEAESDGRGADEWQPAARTT